MTEYPVNFWQIHSFQKTELHGKMGCVDLMKSFNPIWYKEHSEEQDRRVNFWFTSHFTMKLYGYQIQLNLECVLPVPLLP